MSMYDVILYRKNKYEKCELFYTVRDHENRLGRRKTHSGIVVISARFKIQIRFLKICVCFNSVAKGQTVVVQSFKINLQKSWHWQSNKVEKFRKYCVEHGIWSNMILLYARNFDFVCCVRSL